MILPISILLASLILGGFFYASQINKQESIEKQQQIKLQEDRRQQEVRLQDDRRAEEAKAEQEHKEYVAKRKMECYSIYKKEREKYNNLTNYGYVEECSEGSNFRCQDDSCELIYKNPDYNERVCERKLNLKEDEDKIDKISESLKIPECKKYFRKYR